MPRVVAAVFCFCLLLTGQERIDSDVNARIRKEALENSKILRTIHYLTDVYGPRLTGSPQFKAASEWAAGQMREWGLANAHLETWDFGRDGWSNERTAAFLTAPVKHTLVAEALAWTPGTNGTVSGACVQLVAPERPTQEEFTAWLESQKDRVRGKLALAGKHTAVPVSFTPLMLRMDDKLVQQRYDPKNPAPAGPPFGPMRPAEAKPEAGRLTPREIGEQLDRFLKENGALVRINDSARPLGQVRALQNRAYDVSKAPPTLVLRNEDFGRISRLLGDGLAVEMEVQVVNRTHPEGRTACNVVAEIPGADKQEEVVLLGGHLDSWHAATGATDDASGVAVMMEAARILKAIGVEPRRTIRVALWGGEEQGLLGSQAYVKEHFGTAESPKPEFARLVGYFNIDAGTGRARGLSVFGPPEAAAVLRQIIEPFADIGVAGAVATRSRRLGGSDHTSFAVAGLPGIGVNQDPIEYFAATWHTNLDTYERIVEDDVKKSAMVVVSAVYHLAMREQMLPRFAPGEMPPAASAARPAAPAKP